MNPKRITNGFTLLEILLVVLIMGIIMATVLGSFNMVFSTVDAIEQSVRIHEAGKTCLDRMIQDLKLTYVRMPPLYQKPKFNDPPDPYRIVGEPVSGLDGDFATIRFTSEAHLGFETSDLPDQLAEIIYYVQQTEHRGYVLKRADALFPYKRFEKNQLIPSPGDPILCEHVKSFRVTFYNADGEEISQWDSESEAVKYATPRAVKIQLEIGREDTSAKMFETLVAFRVFRDEIK